jgi:hypothetical protein
VCTTSHKLVISSWTFACMRRFQGIRATLLAMQPVSTRPLCLLEVHQPHSTLCTAACCIRHQHLYNAARLWLVLQRFCAVQALLRDIDARLERVWSLGLKAVTSHSMVLQQLVQVRNTAGRCRCS